MCLYIEEETDQWYAASQNLKITTASTPIHKYSVSFCWNRMCADRADIRQITYVHCFNQTCRKYWKERRKIKVKDAEVWTEDWFWACYYFNKLIKKIFVNSDFLRTTDQEAETHLWSFVRSLIWLRGFMLIRTTNRKWHCSRICLNYKQGCSCIKRSIKFMNKFMFFS